MVWFNSGLLIQYGRCASNKDTEFPIAYTTQRAIVAMHSGTDGTTTMIEYQPSSTLSQFHIGHNHYATAGSIGVMWVAIGY